MSIKIPLLIKIFDKLNELNPYKLSHKSNFYISFMSLICK